MSYIWFAHPFIHPSSHPASHPSILPSIWSWYAPACFPLGSVLFSFTPQCLTGNSNLKFCFWGLDTQPDQLDLLLFHYELQPAHISNNKILKIELEQFYQVKFKRFVVSNGLCNYFQTKMARCPFTKMYKIWCPHLSHCPAATGTYISVCVIL